MLKVALLSLLAVAAQGFAPRRHALSLRRAQFVAKAAKAETAAEPAEPVATEEEALAKEPVMAAASGLGTEVLDELTLAKQSTAMDALAKEWRGKRIDREFEESKLLGFSPQAEIINGRSAMFFIVVGLLTEAFSGESIPQQVETMAETFGIIGLS
jgi:hypothetical protein